jgi:hypothetical protein
VEVTFPRFILAEVNTHRMLSRNSASSRAIPPEKIIERVAQDPFIPETFNARVKGMGVGNSVDPNRQDICRLAWLDSRNAAVAAAMKLIEQDIDKSRINRLLEPFMWHTAIISATDWENFFALRCPPGDEMDIEFPAQPEFQLTALAMRKAMRASEPVPIASGHWHLPLVGHRDRELFHDPEDLARISAGRCARISYGYSGIDEDPYKSLDRAFTLEESGHMSPFEHQAMATGEIGKYSGNFEGWEQYRKQIIGEENMVGLRERRDSWEDA